MKPIRLLVIDPQNDFLDLPGAALPVAGADADMQRLASWLAAHGDRVSDLVVTLDSHASVGIERTSFWQTAEGTAIAGFTAVTAADVRGGRVRPRDRAKQPEVLAYLDALESQAARTLVVWPIHCVLGTWGHNIQSALGTSIAAWEARHVRPCRKVLKGLNPMTEQYSAFKAEVPRADDPSTALNTALVASLQGDGAWLAIAGEALSHCVAASVDDLIAGMDLAQRRRTVLLTDCMSPVAGFEAAATEFLERARTAGLHTAQASELLDLVEALA